MYSVVTTVNYIVCVLCDFIRWQKETRLSVVIILQSTQLLIVNVEQLKWE